MINPPPPSDEAGTASRDASPPRMPRWVKVSAIAAAVLVLLVVVVMLIGGDKHGPGRHAPAGDAPGSSDASENGGHAPPGGGHG